jgi:non-ribosomal peptide synthetase component F
VRACGRGGRGAEGVGRAGARPLPFLAVFSVLLSRLAGQAEFAIGTPVTGRPLPELADVIGFFANTVVYRADVSGDPDARALMARTRERVGAMLAHQMTPFDRVVEALHVPRDPSRNPLFQVAFDARSRRWDLALAGDGGRIDAGFARASSTFRPRCSTSRRGRRHLGALRRLFERSTIERMSRQFARLVAAMAAAPDRPAAPLPLMDDVSGGGARRRDRRTPPYVGEGASIGFATAAAASRDAAAFAGVSYAELDAHANRLARVLRERGAGRGAFVAIACRGAEDTARAWLATLKAGAAYLPIDAELPGERLDFMLADAGVRCASPTRPGARLRAAASTSCVLRATARDRGAGGGGARTTRGGRSRVPDLHPRSTARLRASWCAIAPVLRLVRGRARRSARTTRWRSSPIRHSTRRRSNSGARC